jgi:REP element-mobilizing transposase RayT
VASRHPVHVSLKVNQDIGSLRTQRCFAALRAALAAGCEQAGFRVCQFSVLATHIHLVVEAKDREALARGMQGLTIRMARHLNRALGRRGRVFADRYYARVLKTPREVRNALAYVLNNDQRHRLGKRPGLRALHLDPFSSAPTFDGWRVQPLVRPRDTGPPAVVPPQTWLLATGWRRHGRLVPAYVSQTSAPP